MPQVHRLLNSAESLPPRWPTEDPSSQYAFVFLVIFDQADALLTVCKSDLVWPLSKHRQMHFNALRSLTQPCLNAYCVGCNTPMIQALYQALQVSVSLGKCI